MDFKQMYNGVALNNIRYVDDMLLLAHTLQGHKLSDRVKKIVRTQTKNI